MRQPSKIFEMKIRNLSVVGLEPGTALQVFGQARWLQREDCRVQTALTPMQNNGVSFVTLHFANSLIKPVVCIQTFIIVRLVYCI